MYSRLGFKSYFAKIRFWDSPYREVEKLISKKGVIVDLGCGEGVFSNYLALTSFKRKVFGFDIDKKRVSIADRGLKNTVFENANVLNVDIPKADTIILFHLLHHLNSFFDQEKLLKKCINSLNSGGRIVVVEIDVKPTLKYLTTWFTDHFLVPWIFEGKFYSPDITFRNKKGWVEIFNQLKLKYRNYDYEKRKPFTHTVFVCTRNE